MGMARTYLKVQNGWKHPASKIDVSTKNGRTVYSGIFMVGDRPCKFRLSEQPKGDYLLRGTLSLLAHKDNKVLQCTGSALKAAEEKLNKKGNWDAEKIPHPREKAISVELRCNCTALQEVQAYIAKRAVALCEQSADAIRQDIIDSGTNVAYSLTVLWNVHYQDYMKSYSKRSADYQNDIKKGIGRVANDFSVYEAKLITPAMVKRYADDQNNSPAVMKDLQRMAEFFAFCQSRNYIDRTMENPFRAYLSRTKRGKDWKKAESEAFDDVCLTTEDERLLRGMAQAQWNADHRWLAVVLANEQGFSPQESAKLRVRDLSIQPDPLRITIFRRFEHVGSATQAYPTPCTPFCAALLYERYLEIQRSAKGKDFSGVFICGEGHHGVTAKSITDFARQMLRRLHIRGNGAAEGKEQLGIRLLRSNFVHRLKTYCALGDEKGAMNYLQGRSLANDTTSDHYRCFSDPEGQEFLYRALERDRRFVQQTFFSEQPAVEALENGSTVYHFSPARADRRSVIQLEATFSEKGTITIANPTGAVLTCES